MSARKSVIRLLKNRGGIGAASAPVSIRTGWRAGAWYSGRSLRTSAWRFYDGKSPLRIDWTRDPFDRIIVAEAGLNGSVLVAKDQTILAHYPHARW